jgi:hypothetical protein
MLCASQHRTVEWPITNPVNTMEFLNSTRNRQELIQRVAEYRSFYNTERAHESLDYRTPASLYLANIAVNSSNLNAG